MRISAPPRSFSRSSALTGEIATNLGPVATYAGRLASLLGRHDLAEQHLARIGIADAFDWDYHRAAILIARAGARRRSARQPGRPGWPGQLGEQAQAWLATAERICVAVGCLACSPPSRRSAGDAPVMRR